VDTSTLQTLKAQFKYFVESLQNEITQAMLTLDPSLKVTNDPWERKDHEGKAGGGGLTRYHQGEIFESAGVNTSTIFGAIDSQFAAKLPGGESAKDLWATGISLIIHPRNPRVPTVHANFRMIHQGDKIWLGGGADLTPYYPHIEDFAYFHGVWKAACAPFGCYEAMKKECDHYFTNHHRGTEMRGIGGIFFDHYFTGDLDKDLQFSKSLAGHFIESYFPIVKKRMHEKWTEVEEDFQLHRRGRYVEFNLLHDRGTLFGLKTNGRVESILISLPPRVKYTYNYRPQEDSPQAEMMKYYQARSW
jgi:coproporphyrinogen III oxidase